MSRFALAAAALTALGLLSEGALARPVETAASARQSIPASPDPAAERQALLRAADAGNAAAQWELGMMLLNGRGGPADAVGARRQVRRSAEAGYVNGQISYAVMLALGQGGPTDEPEARVWYQRAAEQGSAHALRGLGAMLLVGQGGAADPILGMAYIELAAEAGDEMAGVLMERLRSQGVRFDRIAVDKAKAEWVGRRGYPTL